jgi:hypothetical protein
MRQHLVLIVFKLYPERGVWQSLKDLRHELYRFFLRHKDTGAIPPLLANFGY